MVKNNGWTHVDDEEPPKDGTPVDVWGKIGRGWMIPPYYIPDVRYKGESQPTASGLIVPKFDWKTDRGETVGLIQYWRPARPVPSPPRREQREFNGDYPRLNDPQEAR